MDFRDDSPGTELLKRRVKAFWYLRCDADIKIIVVSAYTFQRWMTRDSTPCGPGQTIVGAASITHRTIGIPASSLWGPDWQVVLEHELLHIRQPELSEEEVEQQAVKNVAEHPINF